MARISLPTTKATGMGPLPQLLEQHCGEPAVLAAFQNSGVPHDVVRSPETHIPVDSMRDLFNHAARAVGSRIFGFQVGNCMTHQSYGLWMKYCAQAPNLREGLRRTVKCGPIQQPGASLALVETGSVSIWRYLCPSGLIGNPMQLSDHLIGPMMRFVQSFLGPDWRPEWVELDYPRDPLSDHLERALALPVRFGAPGVGLAIRKKDLNRRSTNPAKSPPIVFSDVLANEQGQQFDDSIRSVFLIVCLRLLDGRMDIEGTAQALGWGVQSLQRALRREGTDYRTLLAEAKRIRAMSLLAETKLPVTEIALILGYSDHANFTRAFKKLTGIPPAAYRARNSPVAGPSLAAE